MLHLWLSLALAADAIVALRVTDPSGAVVLDDEVLLPLERVIEAADQRWALAIWIARFDDTRGVIELGAGPLRGDGTVRVKVSRSDEFDRFDARELQLVTRRATWSVRVMLGEQYSSPPAGPAPEDGSTYVLVWDDAPLLDDVRAPASTLVVRPLPDGRTDPASQASPAKRVDAWGETHLEVAGVADPSRHCVPGSAPAGAVQHYVGIEHRVEGLTTAPLSVRFPDGTGYSLAAGVPVFTTASGSREVRMNGLTFPVAADTPVGAAYQRSAQFPSASGPMSLAPGIVGATAQGDVVWAGPGRLPVAGLSGVDAPIGVLRVPCAEVTVRLTPASLRVGRETAPSMFP